MRIQPIVAPRLYQRIADEIARLIDSGTFAPGERLPAERELARSLNVSRSSLREALGELEMQGRIVVRVGAGAYVGRASRRRASRAARAPEISPFDVLRTRRIVEVEAAALAARNATPEQLRAGWGPWAHAIQSESYRRRRARVESRLPACLPMEPPKI